MRGAARLTGHVLAAGFCGGMAYSAPYGNWFGLPANYIVPEIGMMVVGWFVAGLATAAVVKKTATAKA